MKGERRNLELPKHRGQKTYDGNNMPGGGLVLLCEARHCWARGKQRHVKAHSLNSLSACTFDYKQIEMQDKNNYITYDRPRVKLVKYEDPPYEMCFKNSTRLSGQCV